MYHTVIRFVSNKEDAEDITQDTFIKVFAKIHTYNGKSTIGAWMKKIAINTALQFLRKYKNMRFTSLENDIGLLEEPSELKTFDINVKLIHEAIKKLPAGCRSILNLYLMEGYKHKEIAQILDISESTSKTQYRRARLILKDNLIGAMNKN